MNPITDRLRYASPKFWRGVCVCGVVFVSVVYVMSGLAHARDATGQYSGSANAEWFESQHNAQGQWCCSEADGHRFYGYYKLNENGSVTILDGGERYDLPAYMVLQGPNPVGSAVWWFTTDQDGARRSYCFAPGSLT